MLNLNFENMKLYCIYIKLWQSICLIGIILGITACINDDILKKQDGANLFISVSALDSRVVTRADISQRNDRSKISNMNIILVSGDVIKEILFVDENSPVIGQGSDVNGVVSNKLPIESGGTLEYHISSTDLADINRIYIVCNYEGVNDQGNLNGIHDLNQLNFVNENIKKLQELKDLSLRKRDLETSVLYGEARCTGKDEHGGRLFEVMLKRDIAMVTVSMKAGQNLSKGVKITPTKISLHNVPDAAYIGLEEQSKINKEDIRSVPEVAVTNIEWGSLTLQEGGKVELGGHGMEEGTIPLFLYENVQPDYDNTGGQSGPINGEYKDQIEKAPELGHEDMCSYIEIVANYNYDEKLTGTGFGDRYMSGTIKYRLYLGEDITKSFAVKRNKHYQVTLSLNGLGGLYEDGRVNEDGSFIINPEDLSWRVDSEGITGGGTFLDDKLNMASNGFLSYVPIHGEVGKDYVVIQKGHPADGWLQAQLNNNYGWGSLTGTLEAEVYKGSDIGLNPDLLYIQIYAQCWTQDQWSVWINKTHGDGKVDLNKLQDWIDKGYREATLELREDDSKGKVVSELVVRQWLPMPIFEEDNQNPLNAELYYSRIDVYEGQKLRWGPASFDDQSIQIDTKKLHFDTNYNNRDYNEKYGFDVCAAVYFSNKNLFNFKSSSRPDDAMSVAVFRAGNAQSSQAQPNMGEYREMYRIGLPTVEEWEKIKVSGVIDPKFPISVIDEYWTASIDGVQSKVYNYGRGEIAAKSRSEKYRVRLIYHKYDHVQYY